MTCTTWETVPLAYSNSLSDSSTPHAHWWDGSSSGMNLNGFSVSGMYMTFKVGSGGSGLSAPVLSAEPAVTPGTTNTIYWSAVSPMAGIPLAIQAPIFSQTTSLKMKAASRLRSFHRRGQRRIDHWINADRERFRWDSTCEHFGCVSASGTIASRFSNSCERAGSANRRSFYTGASNAESGESACPAGRQWEGSVSLRAISGDNHLQRNIRRILPWNQLDSERQSDMG